MVEFTQEQSHAISEGVSYLDNFEFRRQEVWRLFGPAGTGKTTLAQKIAAAAKRRVMFMAFTGKAALVLASKGCDGAATIHKTIFIPRGSATKHYQEELAAHDAMPDSAEKTELAAKLESAKKNLNAPIFVPRELSEFPRDTAFCLDEVSMVDKPLGEAILKLGFPVIALGDPYQLKPIAGEGFFTNAKPDILLEEIHRQKEGNAVLKLATFIRTTGGLRLPYGTLDDSRITRSMTPAEYAEYDQVICGMNKTRIQVNHAFRKMQKRTKVLEIGEKLICLQNNYEVGVMNGSMWRVEAATYHERGPHKYYRCNLTSLDMPDSLRNVNLHVMPLLEGTKHHQRFWLPQMSGNPEGLVMTYGSAITGHKSQGSQWDSVAVIDEWNKGNADYKNWLYTVVSRAAKRVTIVRK